VRGALVIGACLIAGAAQSQSCRQPSPTAPWLLVQKQALSEEDGAWKDDSLRKALIAAAGMKSASVAPQLGWMKNDEAQPAAAGEAFEYLKKQAATRGAPWPNRTAVGLAGVRAVFLIAQRDTALLRVAMRRMMEGGPDEGIKPDIAVIEDRVRLLSGRKQLYGTQLGLVNGKYVPLAIEDSAHVNLRRESANLPPLAWSVCNANSR
jgi:hypothetical protein